MRKTQRVCSPKQASPGALQGRSEGWAGGESWSSHAGIERGGESLQRLYPASRNACPLSALSALAKTVIADRPDSKRGQDAGPAIIVFSRAQRLVYRTAVDCRAIVWWLQGQGLAPALCMLLGRWPAILRLSPRAPRSSMTSSPFMLKSSPPAKAQRRPRCPAGLLGGKALGD